MGILKTKGIIIAENKLRDFDKMLTMVTPDLGKISCVARGARRQNSSLMAGTGLLTFGEYILYKSQDIYNINSVDIIEVFYNIRIDYEKLKGASYITKIINDITTENQNTYKILKLFLNTLYTISETNKDLNMVVSFFRLRLLKMIGFCPNVTECVSCGTKENIKYFSIKDNGIKCEICGRLDKSAIKISDGAKISLQYALYAEQKKLFSCKLSEEVIKEIEIVSKIYMENKLEKHY